MYGKQKCHKTRDTSYLGRVFRNSGRYSTFRRNARTIFQKKRDNRTSVCGWKRIEWITIYTIQRVRKSKNRSEEHTSELQSRQYLVCCLLLEKKICITF